MIYGNSDFSYEPVAGWGTSVQALNVHEVAGVAVDGQDRLYLLSRNVPPVIVLDCEGTILEHWGEDIFHRAHGMTLAENGSIYGVDDGNHAVYRFSPDHHLELVLGTPGIPSDTGYTGSVQDVLPRSAGPFNRPTRLAIGPDGCIYVSDGYGNARVHKFRPDGILLKSWGMPGDGAGQFRLPHGIACGSDGTVYVCDRMNHRIQLFTPEGRYLTEWRNLHRPSDILIHDNVAYIAECKRTATFDEGPSRVSILDLKGNVLARLESGQEPEAGQPYRCAHGIAVDSRGDIYIGEVSKKYDDTFLGIKKYRKKA